MECNSQQDDCVRSHVPVPRQQADADDDDKEKRKALIEIVRSAGSPTKAIASAGAKTMASAAPKPAADDKPSVKGSASGLRSADCINDPEIARLAPAIAAVHTTGRRSCQMITRTVASAWRGSNNACTTAWNETVPAPIIN